MKAIKSKLKQLATFIYHPIIAISLMKAGTKNFTILPQMTINDKRKLVVGDDFYLGRNSRFIFISNYKGKNYHPSMKVGKGVSIGNRFTALSAAPITIGDDCLLASDILITSENHGIDPEISTNYAQNPLNAAPVSLEEGCWIGEKVIILPGVSLGKRCVVAAGAVVKKSFPAYTIVAGVPAKIIKKYDFEKHEWVRVDA